MVVNHLSKLRKGLGFGATELARAAGVSRQAIHAIESGAFVPNTAVALRLAAVLGVSVEELFSIEDPVPDPPGAFGLKFSPARRRPDRRWFASVRLASARLRCPPKPRNPISPIRMEWPLAAPRRARWTLNFGGIGSPAANF